MNNFMSLMRKYKQFVENNEMMEGLIRPLGKQGVLHQVTRLWWMAFNCFSFVNVEIGSKNYGKIRTVVQDRIRKMVSKYDANRLEFTTALVDYIPSTDFIETWLLNPSGDMMNILLRMNDDVLLGTDFNYSLELRTVLDGSLGHAFSGNRPMPSFIDSDVIHNAVLNFSDVMHYEGKAVVTAVLRGDDANMTTLVPDTVMHATKMLEGVLDMLNILHNEVQLDFYPIYTYANGDTSHDRGHDLAMKGVHLALEDLLNPQMPSPDTKILESRDALMAVLISLKILSEYEVNGSRDRFIADKLGEELKSGFDQLAETYRMLWQITSAGEESFISRILVLLVKYYRQWGNPELMWQSYLNGFRLSMDCRNPTAVELDQDLMDWHVNTVDIVSQLIAESQYGEFFYSMHKVDKRLKLLRVRLDECMDDLMRLITIRGDMPFGEMDDGQRAVLCHILHAFNNLRASVGGVENIITTADGSVSNNLEKYMCLVDDSYIGMGGTEVLSTRSLVSKMLVILHRLEPTSECDMDITSWGCKTAASYKMWKGMLDGANVLDEALGRCSLTMRQEMRAAEMKRDIHQQLCGVSDCGHDGTYMQRVLDMKPHYGDWNYIRIQIPKVEVIRSEDIDEQPELPPPKGVQGSVPLMARNFSGGGNGVFRMHVRTFGGMKMCHPQLTVKMLRSDPDLAWICTSNGATHMMAAADSSIRSNIAKVLYYNVNVPFEEEKVYVTMPGTDGKVHYNVAVLRLSVKIWDEWQGRWTEYLIWLFTSEQRKQFLIAPTSFCQMCILPAGYIYHVKDDYKYCRLSLKSEQVCLVKYKLYHLIEGIRAPEGCEFPDLLHPRLPGMYKETDIRTVGGIREICIDMDPIDCPAYCSPLVKKGSNASLRQNMVRATIPVFDKSSTLKSFLERS
jgi:hypothetical protein